MTLYTLEHRCGTARAGRLRLPHGEVETPIFMPVGTAGSVKAMSVPELRGLGAQIILGNTYHLWLRPGLDVIRVHGDLHRFSGWPAPILTDSGGYQVFSLRGINKITEEGVSFRSHIDGSAHLLTPERSMEIQAVLGSDIAMAFDHCPPGLSEPAAIVEAMTRTTAWARRCLAVPPPLLPPPIGEAAPASATGAAPAATASAVGPAAGPAAASAVGLAAASAVGLPAASAVGLAAASGAGPAAASAVGLAADLAPDPALGSTVRQQRFGIVQGGIHLDLRRRHMEEICALPFDGFALGGFSVGEPIPVMYELLRELAPQLPQDRPRYLMGVGTPRDLLMGIASGIDMFDCVMPTRNARNGQLFTSRGRLTISNARFARDTGPVDPACRCETCTRHTLSYLRHLFMSHEILYSRLATLHNLTYYLNLTQQARQAILEDRYPAFLEAQLQVWPLA